MSLTPSLPPSDSIDPSDSVSCTYFATPATLSTASAKEAPREYATPPDSFIRDRIEYIRRATVNKKSSNTSSNIWKFGERYIRQSDEKEVFYCYECAALGKRQDLFVYNGAGFTAAHLKKAHHIIDGGKQNNDNTRRQRPTIIDALKGRFYFCG